jgi:hypothetical protein
MSENTARLRRAASSKTNAPTIKPWKLFRVYKSWKLHCIAMAGQQTKTRGIVGAWNVIRDEPSHMESHPPH